MENFDINNSVNPFLIKGALILYRGDVCHVVDMDKEKIFIKNQLQVVLSISDDKWQGINLNSEWLERFNLSLFNTIKNPKTLVDWIIKSTGKYYYITIFNIQYGDNPVIGLKYVHQLQEWYFRLTGQNLELN
jgi:hypothetical protein